MTLARHMHYIYLTADMNMVTLMTLWLFSSRSTHRPFCFHMNKCTSSCSTKIVNSSPNNIWTSVVLCLTSFIHILHVVAYLTRTAQSHAFRPVLSRPVHGTATCRVGTFWQRSGCIFCRFDNWSAMYTILWLDGLGRHVKWMDVVQFW